MKKLVAFAMAAMMCAAVAPLHAADDEVEYPQKDTENDISTEEDDTTSKGEVWALLSSDSQLEQMKVTVPIRLHFAVLNRKAGEDENTTPLQFETPHAAKYAVAVDKSSTVGVKVTKVKVEKPQNGAWTLEDDKTEVEKIKNNPKAVALRLNGDWMKLDEEHTFAKPLIVAPNESKPLPFTGAASMSKIEGKKKGIYEKAFNVTYTLEMDKPEVTPAS